MKEYVKYSPQPKYRSRESYREVWQGLPAKPQDFVRVPLLDGYTAWSYSENGHSIWILDAIMQAYKQNPRAIFIVTIQNSGNKPIMGIRQFEGTLEDAIQDADYWNKDDMKWGKSRPPKTKRKL